MVATPFTIDLNLNDPFCITDHDTVDDNDDDETVYNLSRKNKKLKEMLTAVLDEYNSLTTHVKKLMEYKEEHESSPVKRKLDHDETVEQGSWKRPKEDIPVSGIKRVYVKVDPSDKSLVVKDGYQWRKYGQKVTRDNPSPRAYYKCSFAPICPVKKKVQRSVDDDGVVVATYEGEHNHRSPMQEAAYALANERDISTNERWFDSPKQLDEVLVGQMANYLCKDPNFTSELAAAITSRLQDLRSQFLQSMLMN